MRLKIGVGLAFSRDFAFIRRLLIAAAFIIIAILVVKLADVLLLVFGAILVAVLLHAIAAPVRNHTPLGRTASLIAAVLIAGSFIAAGFWAFGSQLETQLASLAELLPRAWKDVQAELGRSPMGGVLLQALKDVPSRNGDWLALAPRYAVNLAATVAGAVVVWFAGLYLAFHPQTYAQGLIGLLPRRARERAGQIMEGMNEALKRWLLGQLLSMGLIGATTTLGLWLVGVPSPIGLGILAGAGQFVPVVGPIAATAPGLVVALAAGPQTFVLASVVYLGAAQLEANIVTPLVLRRMAELPMAVTLFAVLAMGVLLGPLGVLFATPLAVVIHVLVKKVYVEGLLGEGSDAATPPKGQRKRWRWLRPSSSRR